MMSNFFSLSCSIRRIVLESDPIPVVQRVAVKPDDLPLGEQTVAQVFQSAKEQIKWSLLR